MGYDTTMYLVSMGGSTFNDEGYTWGQQLAMVELGHIGDGQFMALRNKISKATADAENAGIQVPKV